MPAAASSVERQPGGGNKFLVRFTLTYSGTYATGGEVVTAASLGLTYVDELIPLTPNEAGIDAAWDGTKGASPKVLLYDEDDTSGVAAERAAATTTTVVRCLAYGI
jgi:hypothetical protein